VCANKQRQSAFVYLHLVLVLDVLNDQG